jgi:hypothetical protein
MGVLAQRVSSQSDNLPAASALEGRIVEDQPTPGKYGHAVIAGVQFGVTGIRLRLGAIIFECSLMTPSAFAFTVEPGSPARIYGTDGQLVADYAVPGVGTGATMCVVRPEDRCTIFLPLRISDIRSASPEDARRFDNEAFTH